MKVTSSMGYQRIFVSYARTDGTELALRLQKDLTAVGYEAWIDTRRIEGGAFCCACADEWRIVAGDECGRVYILRLEE